MDLKEYKLRFISAAQKLGYTDVVIDKFLAYSERLLLNNLPVVFDQEHLSRLIGYKYSYLLSISNSPSLFYKTFNIPKKNGKYRIINAPLPDLKIIQEWILIKILVPSSKKFVSPVAKAYMPKGHLIDNARFHQSQKYVLCLDLTDFFGSISLKQTYDVFLNFGYSKSVSFLLTKLCVFCGHLPQGAPTSPMLSNLVFKSYDDAIFTYCRKHNIRYTRYADDLTFSGDDRMSHIIPFLRKLFKGSKFSLNISKTRVLSLGCRQQVTGIVVNHHMQASATYRKKIRQEVYYIIKFGLTDHLQHVSKLVSPRCYLQSLLGRINYTLSINPNDLEMKKYYDYIRSCYINFK